MPCGMTFRRLLAHKALLYKRPDLGVIFTDAADAVFAYVIDPAVADVIRKGFALRNLQSGKGRPHALTATTLDLGADLCVCLLDIALDGVLEVSGVFVKKAHCNERCKLSVCFAAHAVAHTEQIPLSFFVKGAGHARRIGVGSVLPAEVEVILVVLPDRADVGRRNAVDIHT